MATKIVPNAPTLIEETIDKLRIDSAWLRMNSRDEADAEAARVLETCSQKIRRVSESLERLARGLAKTSN
jgi:hypothetical protein